MAAGLNHLCPTSTSNRYVPRPALVPRNPTLCTHGSPGKGNPRGQFRIVTALYWKREPAHVVNLCASKQEYQAHRQSIELKFTVYALRRAWPNLGTLSCLTIGQRPDASSSHPAHNRPTTTCTRQGSTLSRSSHSQSDGRAGTRTPKSCIACKIIKTGLATNWPTMRPEQAVLCTLDPVRVAHHPQTSS